MVAGAANMGYGCTGIMEMILKFVPVQWLLRLSARMSGCELPVIIVSGSGNQGIAAIGSGH